MEDILRDPELLLARRPAEDENTPPPLVDVRGGRDGDRREGYTTVGADYICQVAALTVV